MKKSFMSVLEIIILLALIFLFSSRFNEYVYKNMYEPKVRQTVEKILEEKGLGGFYEN